MQDKSKWLNWWDTGHTPWDLGKPHPAVNQLIANAQEVATLDSGSRIWVPGCGSGHEAAALADIGFNVLGSDISQTAIDTANKLYQKPGLEFVAEDALIPHTKAQFDAVLDRAMLCALAAELRPIYLESMTSRLKPLGLYLVILFHKINMTREGPPFEVQSHEVLSSTGGTLSLAHQQPSSFPSGVDIIESEDTAVFIYEPKESADQK